MVRKLVMWGLILCLDHSIWIISLRFALTRHRKLYLNPRHMKSSDYFLLICLLLVCANQTLWVSCIIIIITNNQKQPFFHNFYCLGQKIKEKTATCLNQNVSPYYEEIKTSKYFSFHSDILMSFLHILNHKCVMFVGGKMK